MPVSREYLKFVKNSLSRSSAAGQSRYARCIARLSGRPVGALTIGVAAESCSSGSGSAPQQTEAMVMHRKSNKIRLIIFILSRKRDVDKKGRRGCLL